MSTYELKRRLKKFRYLPSGVIQIRTAEAINKIKTPTDLMNLMIKKYGKTLTLEQLAAKLKNVRTMPTAAGEWRTATAAEVRLYWSTRIQIAKNELSYERSLLKNVETSLDRLPKREAKLRNDKAKQEVKVTNLTHDLHKLSTRAAAAMATAVPTGGAPSKKHLSKKRPSKKAQPVTTEQPPTVTPGATTTEQ